MRIGFVSTFELPSAETNTEQFARTADALAEAGLTIELIVPSSRRVAGTSLLHSDITSYYGLKGSFSLRSFPGPRPMALEIERVFNALSLIFFRFDSFDIVHTRSRGTLFTSILKRQPVVFEMYRALPKTEPLFSRLLCWLLRSSSFLGVICHSEYAARSLIAVGASEDKVKIAYNGYEPQLMHPRLQKAKARQKLGLGLVSEDRVVVYAGNVQPGKGISFLFNMAEQTPQLKWIIVGGQEKHLIPLHRKLAESQLKNISLIERKSPATLAEYLYAADVLIIPPTSAPLERYGRTVLPMKTFLYLAAGRPIIAPNTPDVKEVLTDGETALLTDPDSIEGACDTLLSLFQDRQLQNRLSRNSKSLAERYTWDCRAQQILQLYAGWLGDRKPIPVRSL
ncbi:MAG: glycosyltransferase family 4 protein [Alphaproteobacteria bacterium]|nr:glycosyltransferase family 4 protein [Alphaproteobacteria bacterium]